MKGVITALRQFGYSIRLEDGIIWYRCKTPSPPKEARPLLAELRRRKTEAIKFLSEEIVPAQSDGTNQSRNPSCGSRDAKGTPTSAGTPRPSYSTPEIAQKAFGRSWLLHELPKAMERAKRRARSSQAARPSPSEAGVPEQDGPSGRPHGIDLAHLPAGWHRGGMGIQNMSGMACHRCGHVFLPNEDLLVTGDDWRDIRLFCCACYIARGVDNQGG